MISHRFRIAFLVAALTPLSLFLSACGAGNSYSNGPTNTPTPTPTPSAVVTVAPNSFNAVPGGAAVTLNISVVHDQTYDVLTASVTTAAACGGPCGSFGAVTATGSGAYTVQYTPPANASSATSQTITVSSSLTGSTPGTATVNLSSNAAAVTITNTSPVNAVAGGAAVTLNISVTNDQPSDVLTATITNSAACSSPCGSFGTITPAGSGTYAVQYTPPASIQQTTSQTITISSNLAGSTPGTITVGLTSPSSGFLCPAQGNEQLMAGSWVFLAQGFNGANPMAIGAVFTVDGSAGLIKAGTMDINVAGSAPQTSLAVDTSRSTYSVDKMGRACIGLVTSAGTKVFHAALSSYVNGAAYEGQMEEFDDTAGTGGRAVGTLQRQNPSISSWGNASLNAAYVFGLSGWNTAGGRVSAAGGITFDGAGRLKSGLADVNDAGNVSPAQQIPGGSYTLDATGHGTISFTVAGWTVSGAIYVADAGNLFLLSTSQVSAATPSTPSVPLVAGRVLQIVAPQYLSQTAGFAGYQLVTLEGSNDATIGILNLGLGTQPTATAPVSGRLWQDVGGTPSPQPMPISGTFTIADKTYGRVTFSASGWTNPPVAYFTGFSKLASNGDRSLPTTAFLVGTGSDAEAGEMIWQSVATPNLNSATLKYSAAYSDLQSAGNHSSFQTTSTGQVTFDGMGGFAGSVDVSSNSLSTNVSLAGTYTVKADGSGTFTPTGAANSSWPMVTNGVKSYHIIEPGGNTNTAPVVNVITKR